jgi:uncharacterized membrane protein YqjE
MPSTERSLADVLQDIVRNIQNIVRSEVLLAKTEIREEIFKAGTASIMIVAGGLVGAFALFFLMFSAVYALTRVVPDWAAALIVGGALAVIAGGLVAVGAGRFKQVRPAPEKTIETLKENLEWAKRQAK